MMPLGRVRPMMCALLLVWALPPTSAAAQRGLERVEALAAAGRAEEARNTLETWWDGERTRSERRDRQRGLWLRALLTVDPAMATLDYERLVVEYPGGPYSDLALVRLAMISRATGDLPRAARHYRALLQDYPSSTERSRATAWLAEHAEQIRAAEALAEANIVAGAPAEPDGSGGVSPRGEVAPVGGRGGGHAVQVGAFSTMARAERLAEDLRRRGFASRVVRVVGSPLVRVRIGRFAERSAASALRDEIGALGFEVAVVSDVAEEESVR